MTIICKPDSEIKNDPAENLHFGKYESTGKFHFGKYGKSDGKFTEKMSFEKRPAEKLHISKRKRPAHEKRKRSPEKISGKDENRTPDNHQKKIQSFFSVVSGKYTRSPEENHQTITSGKPEQQKHQNTSGKSRSPEQKTRTAPEENIITSTRRTPDRKKR